MGVLIMGRELRMVPPNWDHPKVLRSHGGEGYQPMFRETFEAAAEGWKRGFRNWENGVRPEYCDETSARLEYWEWSGAPPTDREYYRPWSDEEATWYQIWETVSEGTPVSPPFETQDELIEYLVEHGDYWDQKRREEGRTTMNCDPWEREHAERFVRGAGWAPSFVQDSSGLHAGVRHNPTKQEGSD